MVGVTNRGQEVESTTYWATEAASRGYLHLSFNVGALRALVPEPTLRLMDDLPPAGTPCEYLQDGTPEDPGFCVLIWHDDPDRPHRVAVSPGQVD